MLENIELLFKEPEKLRKAFLMLLKNILITNLGIEIYKCFFGKYKLIDFFSFNQWLEFILNGQILTCVFCYILSYIILFSLIPAIIEAIIYSFTNKEYPLRMSKKEIKLVLRVLSLFNVVLFKDDLKNGEYKLKEGKYTYEFMDILIGLQMKEVKEEISTLRNSFLNNIVHVFFASIIVYYFFIDIHALSKWFHVIIGLSGLLMIVMYIVVSKVYEYVTKNSGLFLHILQSLKQSSFIEATLLECGVLTLDIDYKDKGYDKGLYFKEEDYIWELAYEKNKITSYRIKRYNKICEKTGLKMLLTANQELTETAKSILDPKILLVSFTSQEDLKKQLSDLFQEK